MRPLMMTSLLCLLAAGCAPPPDASSSDEYLPPEAVIQRDVQRGLTGPSEALPGDVTLAFMAYQREGATVASIDEGAEWEGRAGVTHVKFGQTIDGLTVYGSYLKAAVDAEGRLISAIDALATDDGVSYGSATERDALEAALGALHPAWVDALDEIEVLGNMTRYRPAPFFHRAPTVTQVAIPTSAGLERGFLVETWTQADNLLHHTLVGTDGAILGIQLRTNTDSYHVFADHPGVSTQATVSGPGAGNAESPGGWLAASGLTTKDISGNNVHAYLDTDNNNASDGGGAAVTDGNFLAVADLGVDPSTSENQEVAIQNLFYLNNVIHDRLYRHGFVEGVGNFQEDNFGNGGAGGDSVDAEAQDGGGTNNANFATPSDGSNPRMQMYLWTQSDPRRDGDLDSDIVYHEYGHGLTWRMIGNMGGALSGAIGEGQSDVLAIYLNDDDTVGEYSYNRTLGIRRDAYTNYPRTYGDVTGSSVHNDGEIYAATMWRLKELWTGSLDELMDIMVDGMNYTPSNPAYEDMRDGILASAAGSGNECLVWEAFADFGIGEGASGSVKGGGPFGGGKVSVKESFTVPVECTDCTPTGPEICDDGVDNDCDGAIDGADSECDTGGTCVNPGGLPVGDSCDSNADCCSNKCKGGGPSGPTCK